MKPSMLANEGTPKHRDLHTLRVTCLLVAEPTDRKLLAPVLDHEKGERRGAGYDERVRNRGGNAHDVPGVHDDLVLLRDRPAHSLTGCTIPATTEAVTDLDDAVA